jgi:alpha-L-rhamnosidase
VLAPLPAAFNNLFFDEANATYREPNKNYGGALSPQTTISLAWQLGVIPEAHKAAVVETLVDDLAAHGYHLNVGIVGAKFLLPTLVEAGRGDVALMVSQQKTAPSFVYMVEQGATTLWVRGLVRRRLMQFLSLHLSMLPNHHRRPGFRPATCQVSGLQV